MAAKIFRGVFIFLLLAIILYPAYYIYQHPELLETPEIASSDLFEGDRKKEPILPLLATSESVASSETPAPACLLVHALPGGEGSLNLRAGAGTSYAVLAVLHDGQTLVMDGKSGDWFAVTLVMDGRTIAGYVHSDYVEACQ